MKEFMSMGAFRKQWRSHELILERTVFSKRDMAMI
jgi:hypothetical protein